MTMSLAELRRSPYHQELARKMCAAYIAQHQGIALNTAMKKVSGPIETCGFPLRNLPEGAVWIAPTWTPSPYNTYRFPDSLFERAGNVSPFPLCVSIGVSRLGVLEAY